MSTAPVHVAEYFSRFSLKSCALKLQNEEDAWHDDRTERQTAEGNPDDARSEVLAEGIPHLRRRGFWVRERRSERGARAQGTLPRGQAMTAKVGFSCRRPCRLCRGPWGLSIPLIL